ncbi:MAG: energy transducer TonB [Saprospiraceae bacterium]|nr:energy transducer TonB [Saprospiraceae bacterium]
MSKERKDNSFIKKPIYPGGNKALRQFISDNLKYPKEAISKKIEGTVLVKYDIDYKGVVIDGRVIKGIGHGCDEEAIRLVKLLKFEIPKGPRKLRVMFHKELKIHFKIPKTKVLQKQSQLQYHLTQKPKKPTDKKAKTQNRSYGYTINW